MNRLPISIVLAFVLLAPAFAQNGTDQSTDEQAVDTSSTVDRQAQETYSKNTQSPVPAARLAPNRPADMRPKDITRSADQQASETYYKNVRSPVPAAHLYSYRMKHHRAAHRRHVAGDPPIIDHRADHEIVEPTSTNITIPSDN
jgi:hypothetical protein